MKCSTLLSWLGQWCDPPVFVGMAQAFATIITAILIFWITALYTAETRKLRKNSDLSFYISICPYLLISLVRDKDVEDNNFLDVGKATGRSGYLDYVLLPPSCPLQEVWFELKTIGSRMPNHICCVWFDRNMGRYFFSNLCLEALQEGETAYMPVAQVPYEPKDAAILLEHMFEDRWHRALDKLILKSIPDRNIHTITAFYFDHAGKLYATPRPMVMPDRAELPFYMKTDLIAPPGLEALAPTFASTFAKRLHSAKSKRRYIDLRNRKGRPVD